MLIKTRRIATVSFYRKFLYPAGFVMLVVSTPIYGGGIAVMEQSVKELGQAFSGAPTNISDGSMVFFNPAAMSQVRGKLISAAGYYIAPSANFYNSSSQLNPQLGGAPLTGGDGGNSAQSVFIPNLYYVQELSNRLAFGFGFTIPYGMRNSYDSDWKGRYQAIDSEILAINFNPSMSFKLTEKLSLGAGFNVQYMRSKLTNAIDLGSVCFKLQGALPCTNQGIVPQAADGHVSLEGNSVGFGYNIGAFYTLTPNTRFGVSYRSRIAHDVKGNANFSIPDKAIALTQGNVLVDTHAVTTLTLPDSVLFGFSHRLNSRWEVSSDALWTHWSLVRKFRTNFSSSQSDDVQVLGWNDTWRYAFGVNHFSETNKWILRTGFAYDETPVPNAQHRSPRIPDSNRYWLTAGFTYAVRKNIFIHGAYAHLFMNSPSISRSGATGDFLFGQFSEQINIGGLQLDWYF